MIWWIDNYFVRHVDGQRHMRVVIDKIHDLALLIYGIIVTAGLLAGSVELLLGSRAE